MRHRRAVVRDARELEVLVQQLGIRIVARVEHRHAFERHAVAHRVDHPAHDRAHFVVRVRRGHHGCPDRGLLLDHSDVAAQQTDARDHIAIGARVTREPRHHHGRPDGSDRASNRAAGSVSRCGRYVTSTPKSATRPPPPSTRSAAAAIRSCSAYQDDANRADTARCSRTTSRARALCRASTSSAASSRSLSSRCTAANASSVAGCSATGANNPGASASAPRHRGRHHRRRHRPPPRCGQHRRGQQFRQPVHGEERHPDHSGTGAT